MCDAVDDLNYERLSEISNKIIYASPQKMHDMANYQLEKIFSYLGDEVDLDSRGENYKWGLRQAELFSMEFAKKWVTIKPYSMDCNEILLLVRVACYFECKEQNKVV
jgi:oligoribonuclease (3'-5' exoribonuclease)